MCIYIYICTRSTYIIPQVQASIMRTILLGKGEFDLQVLLYYGSGSFCDSSYSMKFKNMNIGILHEIIHSINLFNLIYIHTIVNIL